MSYRVFDTQERKWLKKDQVFLSGFNNDLYAYKKCLFGKKKLELLSSARYVVHNDTRLVDKNNNIIYEGDICELEFAKGAKHKCVISYVPERASYIFFDDDTSSYYSYANGMSKYITIIGNVFDGVADVGGGEE